MFALWLRSTLGQVLARVLGRLLFSERGWARYCGDAMVKARRPSGRTRLGKTSAAERHAFKKRTLFTTRRRTQMSGGAT